MIHRGRILGAVPKSFVPEYHEYYEKRQFRAARDLIGDELPLLGESVPFGAELLFACRDLPALTLHVEICEDLWTPIPPSTYGALAGATVLVNLSASNITIGKAEYRRLLCEAQSGRTIAGYVYTAAGLGESTTDVAWDGQAMICENGQMLVESERFADDEELIIADLDLDRLLSDRMSTSSYGDSIHDQRRRLRRMRRVEFDLGPPAETFALRRRVERFPYVPADPVSRSERCEEVYNIQVRGLQTRLLATGIEKVVIGVSGRSRQRPRADRRRAGDGPSRAAAGQRARLHAAGLRHQRAHAAQRARADEGAGGQRQRARHPPVGHPDAA